MAGTSKRGTVRIGISRWAYTPWRGVFYLGKLLPRRELAFAAGTFLSIEIGATFYGLQRPEAFGRRREENLGNFDNFAKVRAPFDAKSLMDRLA